MSYVVFKTDTLLDIRAITMFGLSAKPNSKSPIGYFGTGLKMAIATLVRNNIPITIYIGKKEYSFKAQPKDFRGNEFRQIMMFRRNSIASIWDHEELNYTVQLAKNWELWMAFRELHANTLDEGGTTSKIHDLPDAKSWATDTTTYIVVGPSDEFVQVYDERGTIFLPQGKRTWDGFQHPEGIEAFHEPSEYLYYRGMRVQKLEKPSIMTYNVLAQQELTEDRTLKEPFWVQYILTNYLGQSLDRGLINHFLNATDQHWESTWNFDIQAPGAVFVECLRKIRNRRDEQRPAMTGRTRHTPIYRTPRMDTVISKTVSLADPKTKLWWHFEQLLKQYVIAELDRPVFDAVLEDLKKTNSEYPSSEPSSDF